MDEQLAEALESARQHLDDECSDWLRIRKELKDHTPEENVRAHQGRIRQALQRAMALTWEAENEEKKL